MDNTIIYNVNNTYIVDNNRNNAKNLSHTYNIAIGNIISSNKTTQG